MKTLFSILPLLCAMMALTEAHAQSSSAPYSLEWEVVAVDSIPGMTTARLYAKLVNPTDYLTSISGWDDMEGAVFTTTSFYQHPDGWATPNNNNPLLFDLLPGLRWDSWVTIGIESAPNGAAGEIPVGLFPPQTDFWVNAFEAGDDLVMDVDGAWFVTLGSSNGTAGEDLKVLVGQFTTDGVISGYLNLQVFSDGVSSDDFMDDVYSIVVPEFDAGGLSSIAPAVTQPKLNWGVIPLEEGRHAHLVDADVHSWMRYDVAGRTMESGRVYNGQFVSQGPGLIVLFGENGASMASRFLKL